MNGAAYLYIKTNSYKLKLGKPPGQDEITPDMIKYIGEVH